MFKRVAILICAVAVSASAYAQQPKPAPAQAKPAGKAETKAEPAPAKPATAPQPINMRIDLTITDQRGDSPAIIKTVSLMTSDTFWGRIRTQGEAQLPNSSQRVPVVLNVDAKPVLVREGMARVELTIEYRPAGEVMVSGSGQSVETPRRDPSNVTPNINESLAVILEDGKSTVISQSADPVGDRKVKVEAKMSILK